MTRPRDPHRLSPGRAPRAAPRDYVVLSISTYPENLRIADAIVERLRGAGITTASRSWLVRQAIERLDIDALIAEHRRPR